ncbi:substrate-binding domain-containing protein [Marinobacter daepoensis]|uniref:Substrate-binding domain-containing protein n=1 Tax=Marinobacter daepoensis TaxID=262077 RepID=A0ABS3BEQ8_9GAMM|nr:substrate-binding domain-containing protein [Marinobacter daepoensis]MBN7770325.1 substrate-binding domain-containing protein [Marinobacter daepoensis]MBY6079771.1 substrate-binding domain-containing protein [Marinobacter daepoensis]
MPHPRKKAAGHWFGLLTAAVLCTSANAHELEIHGSNTVGATLAPMLVSGYLEQHGTGPVSRRPTGTENEQILMTGSDKGRISVLVAAHGSSTGFRTLASGKAQVWASSRPVKSTEASQVREKADLTSLESEHVIAIDGLAVLVHPGNPINAMSIETLAKVFSGQIRNWAELGGPDQSIQLYARDDRSGTWDTFKSLVLGKTYTLDGAAKRYESNDQLSDDVSRDPGGIGFSGLASVRNSKLLAISEGDAPALKPDQLTVASEDYPLSRRLFMYTMGNQTPRFAKGLIEFALAEEGQNLVAESGFVSQNPIAVKPEFDDSVPKSFRRLTGNYQRLTVNFRFAEGRTRLDNKAQRDLLRVKHYLEQQNLSGDDLLLIGFADAQSHELRAQMISELRALSVRKALSEANVANAAYTGYGHYMPVGGKGNQRNGRVEVWIKSH